MKNEMQLLKGKRTPVKRQPKVLEIDIYNIQHCECVAKAINLILFIGVVRLVSHTHIIDIEN